jgi:gliding motility-associated lipoprotein GldH
MAVAVLATAMLLACYSDTVYHHYYPTDLGGWDRAEVFEHNVSPVANGGYYVEEVGIRADASFPYRSVSLVIDQWIIHTQNKVPSDFKSDTVSIDIYDQQGQALGCGVNLRQYTYPFRSVKLQQGDSISLQIHHNMKNKSVSGIANVGLRVSFQYAE